MNLNPRFSRPCLLALLVVAVALPVLASPAAAIRIASYNLLNYDNQSATRNPAFRTVIQNMPTLDVIAVQEVQDSAAINGFRNNVLNVVEPGQWSLATFFNDPSQSFNQGLYYRTSTMTVVAADTIGNAPRDISWYKLRPVGYTSDEASVIVFVHHFKAGSGSSDKSTREVEATLLRNFMNGQPAGTRMMVVGDFNMRSSTENAYQDMVQSQANNVGRVKDPINLPGTWYNNGTFAGIHTQSPRTTNLGDGGATGGMDDRFDQLLITYNLDDDEGLDYIAGTYDAFGQDGQHFNLSIVDAPTIPEGATVASALHTASDHLPVFLELQVPARVQTDASLAFGTVIVGATAQQTLTVDNIALAPADELDYSLAAPAGFFAPGGSFQLIAGANAGHTISMNTGGEGNKAGDLTVSTDDPDNPTVLVPLSGTVLRHAVPSLDDIVQVLADTLDFGTHPVGDFSDSCVSVSNLGYDALQSLLDVHAGVIVGGSGRFSIVGGFSQADVGGTPEKYTLAFDDVGAATTGDTTYCATLTFSTRDRLIHPGALDQSDLVVVLKATVQAGILDADPFAPAAANVLGANRPNPFSARTVISYSLAEAGPVSVTVFDIQGRRVRLLEESWQGQGSHEAVWNGRMDDGREARPGIYFVRLQTRDFTESRRMTKLQ